jgi:outer membrane protein, heavy metal efflux system
MTRFPIIVVVAMFASSICGAAPPAAAGMRLSLVDAEKTMLDNSPALSLSKLTYQASVADLAIAGESPNPQLSINTSAIDYRHSNGSGPPQDKQIDSVLRIDQPFERGNKRQLRQKAARAGEDAAAADYADTLRTARMQLSQAYFGLKYAQEVERVYADMVSLDQRALAAAQTRLNAGDMPRMDVARLEIESAQTNSQWLAAQSATADARALLTALLGIPASSDPLEVTDDWPAPESAFAQPLAIAQRPDIVAATSRRQQALANVDLAKSQQTHDLTVGVQFEHYPQANGANANTVGVGISVPLFLRHRYEGEIRRAMTDRETADEQLRQITLAANNEQQQARTALDSATKALDAVQSTVVDKARETNEAAEFAYQRGAISLTDLLDAHRAYLNLQLDALSTRLRYAQAAALWRSLSVQATDSLFTSNQIP